MKTLTHKLPATSLLLNAPTVLVLQEVLAVTYPFFFDYWLVSSPSSLNLLQLAYLATSMIVSVAIYWMYGSLRIRFRKTHDDSYLLI